MTASTTLTLWYIFIICIICVVKTLQGDIVLATDKMKL